MKKYKVFDIVWDLDTETGEEGEDIDFGKLVTDLPLGKIIEVEDDFDPVEEIADYLSEDYGWCVESCSFEEIRG